MTTLTEIFIDDIYKLLNRQDIKEKIKKNTISPLLKTIIPYLVSIFLLLFFIIFLIIMVLYNQYYINKIIINLSSNIKIP